MSYDYATCRVCALETWYLQVLCRGGLRKYTPSLMHAVSLIVDGCLTILQRAIRIHRFDVMMHAIGSVVQKVEKLHTRITVNPCGCICVSLGLVDDASKVHESSRWKIPDGQPFVPASSSTGGNAVFMSHNTTAEPMGKRVASELKSCTASTARRCKPGFWKIHRWNGRLESSLSECRSSRAALWLSDAMREQSGRRPGCGLTA
jgi:hypothetical protein